MISTIDELRARVSGYAVGLLALSVPVLAVTGQVLGQGGLREAAVMALIAALVAAERRRSPHGLGVQLASSAGLAVAVAALVWLMRGHPWQPDAHMIFFAAFALTGLFCNWKPILLYAGIIAVHHLVLNYALTAAVFPGEASFGRVLLHAVVLIVQAVPLIWLSAVLARLFLLSEANLTEAVRARKVAEDVATDHSRERAETQAVVEALSQAMRRLSHGDLEARMEGRLPRRYAALAAQFNDFVGMIATMVAQITQGAKGLMTSADQMAAAAQQSADQAGEQSATLEQSLRALEGLVQGVQDTTGLALAAEGKVAESRQEAEEGGAILARAVQAMARIEESSGQISRISEVMEDIAFQTNLLALNAGVEAARAGEAGKGFAVVATEVRALAQRATNSAKEIRTLVNTSRENVGEGADLVERTNRSLATLIQRAADNAGTVANIAASMQAQSGGLGELTDKLRLLERVARDGAAAADMSSSLSAALRGDAQAMLTSAEAFRDPRGWGDGETTATDAESDAWRAGFTDASGHVEESVRQAPGAVDGASLSRHAAE